MPLHEVFTPSFHVSTAGRQAYPVCPVAHKAAAGKPATDAFLQASVWHTFLACWHPVWICKGIPCMPFSLLFTCLACRRPSPADWRGAVGVWSQAEARSTWTHDWSGAETRGSKQGNPPHHQLHQRLNSPQWAFADCVQSVPWHEAYSRWPEQGGTSDDWISLTNCLISSFTRCNFISAHVWTHSGQPAGRQMAVYTALWPAGPVTRWVCNKEVCGGMCVCGEASTCRHSPAGWRGRESATASAVLIQKILQDTPCGGLHLVEGCTCGGLESVTASCFHCA